jgi:hypothetical protein
MVGSAKKSSAGIRHVSLLAKVIMIDTSFD